MTKHTHIMVDLETLDTRPSAVILSIGACRVDFEGNQISDKFYRVIDVASCKELGLTESEDTVKWWNRQSEDARKVFTDPNKVSLLRAMSDFATYLRLFGSNSVKLWGNGSDFDNVIIANAYAKLGSSLPWRYYNNRCFRTLRYSMRHLIPDETNRGGTHHNALDDAIFQGEVLLKYRDYVELDR